MRGELSRMNSTRDKETTMAETQEEGEALRTIILKKVAEIRRWDNHITPRAARSIRRKTPQTLIMKTSSIPSRKAAREEARTRV